MVNQLITSSNSSNSTILDLRLMFHSFKIAFVQNFIQFNLSLGFNFPRICFTSIFFLDSCKDNDKELSPSFIKANSARDCFEFLEEEGLFTPSDVIFVQFLLRASNCGELYEKCIEYATTQKRLCYYEEPRSKIFFFSFQYDQCRLLLQLCSRTKIHHCYLRNRTQLHEFYIQTIDNINF